jgi:tripartite ATP-independent transporter DctP family solute receptor
MKRFSFSLVVALLILGMAVGTALSADRNVTLKFSNVTSQSAIDAGKVFKEVAEKESGGSLTINVFDANALGDDRVVIEGTIFGDIDIAVSSTSPMANIFPDFFIFDSPFLFIDPPHAFAGLDGAVGQKILKDMEKKGLKGLAFWENGFRNFTNNKVAVKLPPDVKGMKIRTMENEVHLAAWKAFGANPAPMAFTELFTALQQGTVDGQENPLGIIDGNKFQEVQKYISMTQHVYTPFIMCMNLEKYNSLSANQKAALDKAVKESTTYQRNRSQELEKIILEKCNNMGVVVTHLTSDEKKAWQDVVKDAKIFDLVKAKMENPSYLDELLK